MSTIRTCYLGLFVAPTLLVGFHRLKIGRNDFQIIANADNISATAGLDVSISSSKSANFFRIHFSHCCERVVGRQDFFRFLIRDIDHQAWYCCVHCNLGTEMTIENLEPVRSCSDDYGVGKANFDENPSKGICLLVGMPSPFP